MENLRKRLIHLHRCRGITRRTIAHILRYDPSLQTIYSMSSSMISKQFSLPFKNAHHLYQDLHHEKLQNKTLKHMKTYSIITIVDEAYPNVLKTIQDPPIVLYAKGNVSLLQYSPALSVIGTRKPSKEVMAKMELIVRPIVTKNWLIVSGMARGVDSYAHWFALNTNGHTIAVLGGGFDHIYPKENMTLYHQIAKKGLVLSEYPPDVKPTRYHFPERNRIISGLSFGTLVIEATERSGTLITVDQALDQGREVYAVPGSPFIAQTKGCHQMIQDGAKLVMKADDILEEWEQVGKHLFYTT